MTSTPDRRRPARLLALLALTLALAAGPGGAAASGGADLLRQADGALARGDGIAAEMALRKAMAAGAAHEAVAARMGEAFINQGDRAKARAWLGPARFAPDEAVRGFRLLGQLELDESNLAAAGKALDRALALAPNDSGLWLDIARLRYAGGEQVQAIEAADRAIQLDPSGARALQYRGLLVRDRFGLAAGLPWFEAGLKRHPGDLGLLAEYAATLGEIGRAGQMVVVTRRMLELDPGNERALFLQAVLAARAGDPALARKLLARIGGETAERPAVLLLQGIVELQVGNANHAGELFDQLSRRQPYNRTVRLLLARAIAASGDPRLLADRFGAEARQPEASPYLLTLVGRAYEDIGQRDLAAPLLERAARSGGGAAMIVSEPVQQGGQAARLGNLPESLDAAVPYMRGLLAAGRGGEADDMAERLAQRAPGSAEVQMMAGDLRLARGDVGGAVEAYRRSAAVRLGDDLMLRLVDAYGRAGRPDDAERLVAVFRAATPRSRAAARVAAGFAARRGNWAEAVRLLQWLVRSGSADDARVQADLGFALLRGANTAAAVDAARKAYALQRSSPSASEIMRLVQARNTAAAGAFAAKAQALAR